MTEKKQPSAKSWLHLCQNLHVITKRIKDEVKTNTSVLTVVLEVPGCMVQDCMDPWEPQGVQVVQVGHVGLDLHVDQGDHVGHPLEWLVPEKQTSLSVNKLIRSKRLYKYPYNLITYS